MTKLLRPYIPLEVRVDVAIRQASEAGITLEVKPQESAKSQLDRHLWVLFGDAKYQLDHDPALENRSKVFVRGKFVGYRPDANHPDYLIYREKHAHHIKTNVRGDHGQFADNVIAKRARRRAKMTPLPSDWRLSPHQLRYAIGVMGVSEFAVAVQAHRFKNYFIASGATKLDWDAAWRNWCQQAAKVATLAKKPKRKNAWPKGRKLQSRNTLRRS